MFLLINQIVEGKTNHKHKLYGHATCHKNVDSCAIGSLAFYLMLCFHVTREFADFTADDWMDNSKWFDIKLLANVAGVDMMLLLWNDGYGKHIKAILTHLGIAADDLYHLGRKLGAKILDLLEEETEEVQKMGNWNPSVHDNVYASKLPLLAICKLAGYISVGKIYFNTRTMVKVPNKLLCAMPMGAWSFQAHNDVLAAFQATGGGGMTALNTLKLFCELCKIFLLDAAAMLILWPDCSNHPVFQLEVFQMPEFEVRLFDC